MIRHSKGSNLFSVYTMFAVGARRIDSLDVTESPFEKTMLKIERKNISNRTIYRWSTNCFNQQSNYFQPSQFKRPMEKRRQKSRKLYYNERKAFHREENYKLFPTYFHT